MMEHKQFTKKLVAILNKMPLPEGFKGIFTTEALNYNQPVYIVENKAGDIRLTFRVWGTGTTAYKDTDGMWSDFDRRGVEDSFCWDDPYFPLDKIDHKALIAEQLERIAKRKEFYKTALQIPDIGYSVSPERYAVLKKQMKEKGYVSFYPSGFGTGYHVTKKRCRNFGVKPASAASEKFWGAKPLWIESIECD